LLFGALGPAFGGNGTGFQFYSDRGLIALLMLLLFVPGCRRAYLKRDLASIGICGFVIVYSLYYMFAMASVFGWYVVPLAAATILACASGADLILHARSLRRYARFTGPALAFTYLSMHALLLPTSFRAEKRLQEFVEDGNRKAVGEYLAKVMGPNQTVGSESLGYVGYYSRKTVYDYPGLCSRKVTQFMREHRQKHALPDMLAALRPDYIVLRPREILSADPSGKGWLSKDYHAVREFRVPEAQIQQLSFPEWNIDLAFVVFSRNADEPRP
jgi:hypothetical protein